MLAPCLLFIHRNDQLAAPAIQVWRGVLLVPLVGAINSRRAQQVVQTLLESISQLRARFVIIDVTGVPAVDGQVLDFLVRAVQAPRFLGCRSILVGVGPVIARVMAEMNVDFGGVTVRATLDDGLRFAISSLSGG